MGIKIPVSLETLLFLEITMTKTTLGQNASGIILITSSGYVTVPKNCECSGVYFFNENDEVECNLCHMIFTGDDNV